MTWGHVMRRCLLVGLVMLPAQALAANPEPFSFAVPDGFVDITHETKPPLGVIDDEFYEEAKKLDFLAVKVVDGAVVAAVDARVANGRPPSANVVVPGVKGVSNSTTKLAGIDCLRVEGERADSAKVVALLLPSPERWAQLELTILDPTQYAGLVPVFEAAAARTKGVALPKPPPDPPAPLFFLLGVAALVGTIVGKLIRGRKRSTAWRQAKKSLKANAVGARPPND